MPHVARSDYHTPVDQQGTVHVCSCMLPQMAIRQHGGPLPEYVVLHLGFLQRQHHVSLACSHTFPCPHHCTFSVTENMSEQNEQPQKLNMVETKVQFSFSAISFNPLSTGQSKIGRRRPIKFRERLRDYSSTDLYQ